MFLLSGLSSIAQAIGLPRVLSRAYDDNRLTINNEESRAKGKSARRKSARRKSSFGDGTLSRVSINSSYGIDNEESRAQRKSSYETLTLSPVFINSTSRNILADYVNFANSDDENIPTINDVESLKKGIINISKNKANRPYTILLVGETGVGKSSLLEYIANVLVGNDIGQYNFDILDRTNEQGGSDNQSQTNAPRLYEFTSKNGKVVRIVDTPGLTDISSSQQDELQKRSIVIQIKEHINSIIAVLILANGIVPRVTVGTEYALSTLSVVFPKSFAHNVSFMFTNVLSPLHWNFSLETVPSELRGAPQFLLNNPIALQRKFLKLKDDPKMKKRRADMRNDVKAGEHNALQMLVELFDWLDGLEPQVTTEIVTRSQKREAMTTNILAPMDQRGGQGSR